MKKRWLLVLIFVVVIGVVLTIVFVNLFTKKDTKALAENVYEVTQKGYLESQSDEKTEILAYLDLLSADSKLQEQKSEILDYKKMYLSYEVVGDFFNREIAFAKYTKEYRTNRKKIKDDFEDAQEQADKFASYIKNNKQIIKDDPNWLAQSWANGKTYITKILNKSNSAFNRLMTVYSKSINSKYLNNSYTDIIFSTFKTMANNVLSPKEQVSTNADMLATFVNAYFNDDKALLGFIYNSDLQSKVDDIVKNGESSSNYQTFIEGNLKSV